MPECGLYGALRGRRGGRGTGNARTGMRCSGRPLWRLPRHTASWWPLTFMHGAGNDTKPIRVLSWKRAGHGPGSSLNGAARVCFRTGIATACSAFFRAFPHGVTPERRSSVAAAYGRHGDAVRSRPATSIKQSAYRSRKETACTHAKTPDTKTTKRFQIAIWNRHC